MRRLIHGMLVASGVSVVSGCSNLSASSTSPSVGWVSQIQLSKNLPTARTDRTVTWFTEHRSDRDNNLKRCDSDGRLSAKGDCINARASAKKEAAASFENIIRSLAPKGKQYSTHPDKSQASTSQADIPSVDKRTVSWYHSHEDVRATVLNICQDDPGSLYRDVDCMNATAAADLPVSMSSDEMEKMLQDLGGPSPSPAAPRSSSRVQPRVSGRQG